MSEAGKLTEHEHEEERADSEEIPVWADALSKKFDSMCDRLDALENKGGDREPPRVGTDKSEGSKELDDYLDEHRIEDRDEAKADASPGDESATDMGEKPDPNGELENGVIKEHTDGQKRADLRGHRDDESNAERDEHDAGEKALGEKIEKHRLAADKRADSIARENAELKKRMGVMEARFNRSFAELSFEEKDAIAEARVRADSVYAACGMHVAEPLHGEKPLAYRKRLANQLKKFSKRFKEEDVTALKGSVFDHTEDAIYADALEASKTEAVTGPGVLRPHTFMRGPLQFTEYHGDPDAWMAPFKGVGARVKISKADARS